ncbi:MAG: sigma-54 dependent transcriptional regulator [Acidobacteriota bacterium]
MSTATASPRILIADDQDDVLRALRMLLKDEGFVVGTVSSPKDALAQLAEQPQDLLLADLNYTRDTTSGEEGLELLREVRDRHPELPVVVMTAYGNVDVAVKALQEGARDFIEKPWDNVRLVNVLRAQLDLSAARRREHALSETLRDLQGRKGRLVGSSPALTEILELIDRVADSDATVLITGENGVGKGVVATALHEASGRADRPLVTVDMGTLSGGLIEAELFGHEAGAFTDAKGERAGRFEVADGGTLFLDEIANCPIEQQARLLRVIESGEFERLGSSVTRRVDVRLACATNADLQAEVEAGRFREDLYYRLNTVEIRVPPLRDRREDIRSLAEHFLARFRTKYRRETVGFSDGAEAALLAAALPGNVRELAHAVERAVLLAPGPRVTAADLRLGDSTRETAQPSDWDDLTLDDAEKRVIQRALQRHDGNVREAARQLGVSRSALYRRLERHGIDPSGAAT